MAESDTMAPEAGAAEEAVFDKMEAGAPEGGGEKRGRKIDALLGVSMNVQVVLGRCQLPIAELLDLSRGSVVELDRQIGDPVEVLVTDRLVARGELTKLDGNRVGVKITEIVKEKPEEE